MNASAKKIFIIGGSGFIGSKLTEELLSRGYFVTIVDLVKTRIVNPHLTFLHLNLAIEKPDDSFFDGAYGVINLAGATIGKRWNSGYQKLIYDSRIKTTKTVVDGILSAKNKPFVLVSASAVGYYGDRGGELLREESKPGRDFLATLCTDWEVQAERAKIAGVRVVCIRTAHVLGPGGLLSTLEPLFKRGLGGYFGKGTQYMPWVHYRDVVGLYVFAIEHDISGVFNIGAGHSLSQKELFTQFAKVVHSPLPFLFRIPHVVAKLFLGNFADSLLTSQNTDSSKIKQLGYHYRFENLSTALADLYTQKP